MLKATRALAASAWLACAAASWLCSAGAAAQGVAAQAPALRVGDRWVHEQRDARSRQLVDRVVRTVSAVSPEGVEGRYEPDGLFRWTPELNLVQTRTTRYEGDPRFLSFPLEVGRSWRSSFSTVTDHRTRTELETVVRAFEKVTVPAGTFDAFRVESRGTWRNDTTGRSGGVSIVNWYAPVARTVVKTDYDDGKHPTTTELVELALQP